MVASGTADLSLTAFKLMFLNSNIKNASSVSQVNEKDSRLEFEDKNM